MKKTLFVVLLMMQLIAANAQITKIEHFNVHAQAAPALFAFFKSTFQLPVVYDYQSYGNFSSGGLWLGNTTLEFVDYTGNPYKQAIFKGIALEPKHNTDSIIALLDKNKVNHSAPLATKFKVNDEDKTFWTNTVLNDLTSADVRVFVCDYADRAFVNTPKARANDSLAAIDGGPLGIIGLNTIVFGTQDLDKTIQNWAKIPGITNLGNNTFQFTEGSRVQFEKMDKNSIIEIVVNVKSKERAAQFLDKNQLLKKDGDTIMVDPEQIHGLRIILKAP